MSFRQQRETRESRIWTVVCGMIFVFTALLLIVASYDLVIIRSDTYSKCLSYKGQVERLETELYGEVARELNCAEGRGDC